MDQNTYDMLSLIAAWLQCVGIATAVVALVLAIRHSKRERRISVYESANSPWVEWSAACRQHPQLDVFFIPRTEHEPLTDEERRLEGMIFFQFFLGLERTCVLHAREQGMFGDIQSPEWQAFLQPFLDRENFRAAYHTFRPVLHPELVTFIDSLMNTKRDGE